MTSEQDQARLIAERIARRVDKSPAPPANRPASNSGNLGSELAAVRSGLDELRQRLFQIESRLSSGNVAGAQESSRRYTSTRPQTFTSSTYVPVNAHPSLERFGVEEATVSELVDYFEGEKKCELEPGGKPCDHCDMCSSRGF